MVFINIPDADTKVGQPLDELLMDTINTDLDYLNSKPSGGGSVIISGEFGYSEFSEILLGGEDNIGRLTSSRYSFRQHEIASTASDSSTFDPTNTDIGKRKSWKVVIFM